MANNHDKLAKDLEREVALLVQIHDDDVVALAEEALTIILLRTKQGIDVDGNQFAPYTEDYAETRAKHGLSSQVDLVRTGAMLGSVVAQKTGKGEASLVFLNPLEAKIAAAHNEGVDKDIRVSRGKHKRKGSRHQHLPKREFFDVRASREVDMLANSLGDKIVRRAGKKR